MILLFGVIALIIIIGIALYPIPGMIIHDKIYFAVIDGDGEKAIRLFDRYSWLLSRSDRNSLNERILTFTKIAQMALENQKGNDGN